MTHSPAPWTIVRSSAYTGDPADITIMSIRAADGRTIVYTDSGYFKPREEDVALITAAPEMKSQLDSFVWMCSQLVDEHTLAEPGPPRPELIEQLRELLKRSRGEA